MENIHQISFLNAKEGEKMPYRLSNSKANLQLNHARSTVHSKLRGNIKCWNLQQIQSTQRLYQRKRKLPKTTRKRKTFPPNTTDPISDLYQENEQQLQLLRRRKKPTGMEEVVENASKLRNNNLFHTGIYSPAT